MNSKPDISIIIPCYNSGAYLPEAIDSVEQYKGKHSYEIIIVDDGSTDEITLDLLQQLSDKGYSILHQENKGPAAARNTGILNCKADYILFLDSDNKIRPDYIDEGINILLTQPKVGVVYGNASFFGEKTRDPFQTGKFDIGLLLIENYIDMCAVVRKSAWKQTGGLDEERKLIGHEDWDFWISIYKLGWQLFYINKILFDYRITSNSLLTRTSLDVLNLKIQYVFSKHADVVYENYAKCMLGKVRFHKIKSKPLGYFLQYLKKQKL